MKNKLLKHTKNLLCLAMAFSWIFSSDLASLCLFGEYPYPKKEEE
ncbi:MAG: hypothetical protein Q4D51_00320 [Eubacteriales bacterium]|nr:hypothetical protein [Eubacteriales bacterium]